MRPQTINNGINPNDYSKYPPAYPSELNPSFLEKRNLNDQPPKYDQLMDQPATRNINDENTGETLPVLPETIKF
jgi:hypothetical protein